MNGFLEMALLGLFCLLAGVGLTAFVASRMYRRHVGTQRLPEPSLLEPTVEPEPLPPTSPTEPQAIDETNPPYYSVYRPKNYDPDRAPSCTCHGIKIVPGERILIWPIPHHPEGGCDLFCAATYKVAPE